MTCIDSEQALITYYGFVYIPGLMTRNNVVSRRSRTFRKKDASRFLVHLSFRWHVYGYIDIGCCRVGDGYRSDSVVWVVWNRKRSDRHGGNNSYRGTAPDVKSLSTSPASGYSSL